MTLYKDFDTKEHSSMCESSIWYCQLYRDIIKTKSVI